jgi:acylglycerol lipase
MTVKEIFGKFVDIDIPEEVFPTAEDIQRVEDHVPNCHHGWYKSVTKHDKADEQVELHYRQWDPATSSGKTTPKGILVYIHGIHSHGGHGGHINGQARDVSLLVEEFTALGLKVYSRDMYGHGFSEGTRFFIPSWQDMRDDVVNFIKLVADENPPDLPIFLAGESLGGCMATIVAKELQDTIPNLDSALLICPAIEGDLPPFPVYQILRYVLAPYFPKWRPSFMPEPISPERIWKDDAVREYYMQPCFQETKLDACGLKFSLGTALAMVLAMEEVKSNSIPGLTLPFCITHGNADEGVPISGSQFLYDKSLTPDADKEFHTIEGAHHGLLADPNGPEAIKHMKAFVDKRIKSFKPPTKSSS